MTQQLLRIPETDIQELDMFEWVLVSLDTGNLKALRYLGGEKIQKLWTEARQLESDKRESYLARLQRVNTLALHLSGGLDEHTTKNAAIRRVWHETSALIAFLS